MPEKKSVKEKMVTVMDALLSVIERIAANEKATAEELEVLPQLAIAMAQLTGYAVIEAPKS